MYITGDLHGYIDISKLNSKRFPQNDELTKDDFVFIAGDFGLVWNNKNDEKYWRRWLRSKSFTTLFIDGNHENHELLDSYPIEHWNGGKVHKISDSIIHLMRGQVYRINNYKIFTFGGARSHDKEYRRENINWWSREMPSEEEYLEGIMNLDNHNWEVDIVITHTCPSSTVSLLNKALNISSEIDELNNYLETIKNRLGYKKWYFGHFHNDLELPDNQVLIYNRIEELRM
jgi:DNA repair exonuclease SbcCD nuclease subunit